jgi:hypothetical protein
MGSNPMNEVPFTAQIIFYVMIGLMMAFALLVMWWQIMVMKGKAMKNPDGSFDSYHEQKNHFGLAVADVFVSCPAIFVGVLLVLSGSRWGYYVLALCSYWFLWANIMTTSTSLRFEKPKITFMWFVAFPLGSLLGLAYIVWTFIYFDVIYRS